jgi:hypothetical protein
MWEYAEAISLARSDFSNTLSVFGAPVLDSSAFGVTFY